MATSDREARRCGVAVALVLLGLVAAARVVVRNGPPAPVVAVWR